MLEEENARKLSERIAGLELSGNTVLAFDFDELVVPMHLTSQILMEISKPVNESEISKMKGSFEKIKYLNSLLAGRDYDEYLNIVKDRAKKAKWTPGFKELLVDLGKKYSLIFISSGVRDICEAKLSEIGFNPKNIIAGELEVEDGVIIGSSLIVSDRSKGQVINALIERYRVVGIGHGIGDKFMLDESDVSISFNAKIPGLAQHNVSSVEEIREIIESVHLANNSRGSSSSKKSFKVSEA